MKKENAVARLFDRIRKQMRDSELHSKWVIYTKESLKWTIDCRKWTVVEWNQWREWMTRSCGKMCDLLHRMGAKRFPFASGGRREPGSRCPYMGSHDPPLLKWLDSNKRDQGTRHQPLIESIHRFPAFRLLSSSLTARMPLASLGPSPHSPRTVQPA